MSIRGGC